MIQDIPNILTPLGKTGQHYTWQNTVFEGDIIGFNLDDIIGTLSSLSLVHLIGKISSRVWRDRTTVQFQVVDVVKV